MALCLALFLPGWGQSQPAPTALHIAPQMNNSVELRFTSETGFVYTLQSRSSTAQSSEWQPLDDFLNVPGTGDELVHTHENALSSALLFYRLRIDPEDTGPAEGEILALYEFTGSTPTPQTVHADVVATDLAISSSDIVYGSAQSATWTGSGVPYAQGGTGWGVTNAETAKHFHYTVTADDNRAFAITNIRFQTRSTALGPSAMTIFVNGIEVYSQDLPGDETLSITTPVSGHANMTQAVVRIAGWHNASRETTGGGQLRINDILTEGVVGTPQDATIPVVTAPAYTNITDTTALMIAEVVDGGNDTIGERGVFWSITSGFTPPAEGTAVSETGAFTAGAYYLTITNLPPDTAVYVRAFATNSAGMGISDEASFITERLPVLNPPSVIDPTAFDITETTALMGGTITNDGGGIIVERGIYWSTTPDFDPTEEGVKVYEAGEFETGPFSFRVENLPGDAVIYFRGFAANADAIGFSELYSFETLSNDDLAYYGFTGNNANPESHRDSIHGSALTVSAQSFSYAWTAGQAGDWSSHGAANPYVQSSSGWTVTNQGNAKHFLITLTADSGWLMTITNIQYLARSSPDGPSAVGIAINGDNLHAESITANTVMPVQTGVIGYDEITQAAIRIQGWDDGSRTTTGGGILAVDNILLQGWMSMLENLEAPVVTSPSTANIDVHTATLGGNIVSDGGATLIERGIYWSTISDFAPGQGTKVSQSGIFDLGAFIVQVSQLPQDATIYFRAFATTPAGTGYSEPTSFSTTTAHDGLLALYEFTGSALTPHVRHPHITSSHFIHNTGQPGMANNNPSTWTGSGVPYAQLAGSLAHTNAQQARHFIYAIEARPGITFDVTNISFRARATPHGPSAISLSVDGDVLYTQNMPADQTLLFNIPVTDRTALSLSRIRIHGWDNGSRSTLGTGLFHIDDVRTEGVANGSVIPTSTEGRRVRVGSINVENGIGTVGGGNYEALKSIIQRIDADVVAFQELYANQSNQWSALGAELGYNYTALSAGEGITSVQRPGYFSRYPIQSVQPVLSPGSANEITRAPLRVVINVPDADQPLVLWNAHKKAMNGELDQFRRAVETIRIVQDIDTYRTANPDHDEFIVMGDMNADVLTQSQSTSFSADWYAANEGALPGGYVLGGDIEFPVLYAHFPDDRYTESGLGLQRPVITHADGNGVYTFLDANFISRLDYFFVSDAFANQTPAGEIYLSEVDGTYPGLAKAGDPLSSGASWTSSDHLAIFIDVYMSATGMSEQADQDGQDADGTASRSGGDGFSETVDARTSEETTDTTSPNLIRTRETLAALGATTRLAIEPQPDGSALLRFTSQAGYLYTIESLEGADLRGAWSGQGEFERQAGTGDVMTYIDEQPRAEHTPPRLYRLRIEIAP